MRRTAVLAVLGLAIVASTGACHHGEDDGAGVSGSNAGVPASGAPALLPREDEIDNEKLIAWLKANVDANPGWGGRGRLIGIYLRRGQLRGRLDDFDLCVKYASQEVDLTHSAGAYKARAKCESSLHRFQEADADLEAASHHRDGAPWETLALRGDIARALGKYDEARTLYRQALNPKAPENLVRLANLDVELGELREADEYYDGAAKAVTGKDPGYEAWLEVQRGNRYVESGEFDTAATHLDRALVLDGKNVLAQQFRARLLVYQHEDAKAKAAFEALVAQTDNPEFMSWEAIVLRREGDAAKANALVAQAKARYEADVAAFPQTLWQHYGQFLIDQQLDPQTAVDVLAKNAAARPAAMSWIPLAWAQVDAGDIAGAKATIAKALATPTKTARLYWTASRVARAAGDAKTADALRAKALARNPKIAELMPLPAPAPSN